MRRLTPNLALAIALVLFLPTRGSATTAVTDPQYACAIGQSIYIAQQDNGRPPGLYVCDYPNRFPWTLVSTADIIWRDTSNHVPIVDAREYRSISTALASLGNNPGIVDAHSCTGNLDASGLSDIKNGQTVWLGPCLWTTGTTIKPGGQDGYTIKGMRNAPFASSAGTVIRWTGSGGGTTKLISLLAPRNVEVSGVTLDCNTLRSASYGLFIQAQSGRAGFSNKFDELQTANCGVQGLQIGDQSGIIVPGGDSGVALTNMRFYGYVDNASANGLLVDNNPAENLMFYSPQWDNETGHAINLKNGGGIEIFDGTVGNSTATTSAMLVQGGSIFRIHSFWIEAGTQRCIDDTSAGAGNSGSAPGIEIYRLNCSIKDRGGVSVYLASGNSYNILNSTFQGAVNTACAPLSIFARNNVFLSAKWGFADGCTAGTFLDIVDKDGTGYYGWTAGGTYATDQRKAFIGQLLGGAEITGSIRVNVISNPTPPRVTPNSTGSHTYTYYCVARDANGVQTFASGGTTINNGASTPNNRVQCVYPTGAVSMDVLKTNTSTLLGSLSNGVTTITDSGQATSVYRPTTVNSTGSLGIDNFVSQGVGAMLTSDRTIAPTNSIHHVSGTSPIATIVVPPNFIGGCITLIPDGTWTTNTSGNIALASTAVVNRALLECWDGRKWNPSY